MTGFLEPIIGLGLTTLLLLTSILFIIVHTVWRQSFFLRHGIRGPTPVPLFGHVLDWRKKGVHVSMDEHIKKYGDCCGVYRLNSPVMLVSDPEVIKQILIKHFDRFHNRDGIPADNNLSKNALFAARDNHWKKIRTAITPSLTGRKMKLMAPLMTRTADRLVDVIKGICDSDKQGVFECKEVYGAYIMDTIACCAFGLDIDSQKNKNHPFVSNAKRFFAGVDFSSPKAFISILIPGGLKLLRLLGQAIIPDDVINFFESITNKAMDMRKRGDAGKSMDFLQLVMDAMEKGDDDVEEDEDDDDRGVGNDMTPSSSGVKTKVKREPLTKDELTAQALGFFVAGYETSTTALSFASYLLATNPDQQDRLIDEIDRLAPTAKDITYDNLRKLTFLDGVINETLRIYPSAVVVFRVCTETTTINGHVFPAGVAINIPIWSIHHNPKYWPEPEKFDPDRFSKERQSEHHPFAWLPFGGGPRTCFGMRFAMVEMKAALARTLQEYRLEVTPETEIPPTVGKTGFLNPPNGVTLRAVPRCE